jgi:hypothetical protein
VRNEQLDNISIVVTLFSPLTHKAERSLSPERQAPRPPPADPTSPARNLTCSPRAPTPTPTTTRTPRSTPHKTVTMAGGHEGTPSPLFCSPSRARKRAQWLTEPNSSAQGSRDHKMEQYVARWPRVCIHPLSALCFVRCRWTEAWRRRRGGDRRDVDWTGSN